MSPSEVLVETHVDGNTVTVVRYAPFQELETHAHGEEGLTVVLQGTFLEESLRGTLVAEAGSIATRPYGMPHTNRFGPDGAVILAVIPDRDRFVEPITEWTGSDILAVYRAGLRLVARDENALPELLAAISPREYRTIQLVRRAATLVLGTKAPLSRIAHECGFADHSHMYRAFRGVAGWSPSRLRAS